MPKFTYKAKKGLYQVLEGEIEAENQDEAASKLATQGLFPVAINEVVPVEAPAEKTKKVNKPRKRVTAKDVLGFTQKLTTLIRARVELLSSLRIIYEQTDNLTFQEVLLEIYNSTKEGKAFSSSLANFPKIFSPLYVNLIKTGETSGKMDFALEQISDFLMREDSLRTKIKVALAYPVLLLFVGLASIFVLINFVVPRLKPLFEGLGRDLPLITKIILRLSEFSNKTWWMTGGIVGIIILILYFKRGSSVFNAFTAKLKMYIPVINRLAKNQELAHFSRAFGLLLKSGVPALKSLEISTPTIDNPKLKEELNKVCLEVASGQALSKSMETFTSLPRFFTKMIAVGEESGRLSEVLEEIHNSYSQQIEADIALVTSLIEPVLILVLGLILGTIVLSILLPTFQITQMVR
jgi:general secretion pathway protein F